MDAEIKDWSCKRCTLENPGDLSICQACGGSKLRSLENGKMSVSSAASWTCTKCTLKNPIGELCNLFIPWLCSEEQISNWFLMKVKLSKSNFQVSHSFVNTQRETRFQVLHHDLELIFTEKLTFLFNIVSFICTHFDLICLHFEFHLFICRIFTFLCVHFRFLLVHKFWFLFVYILVSYLFTFQFYNSSQV